MRVFPGILIVVFLMSQSLAAQARDSQVVKTMSEHSGTIYSVAFSPDGKMALSGSADGTLKLWDLASGRFVKTFSGHRRGVNSVAFSSDGRRALSGSTRTFNLWDLSSGQLLKDFSGHNEWVFSLTLGPDGNQALSGGDDNTLKLWDLASGKVLKTFSGHGRDVRSVAFSPDGRMALSGSDDNTLKLWDLTSGKELKTLSGHGKDVLSVAFSPDGRMALSGSDDNTLKLWDLTSGQALQTLAGHGSSVMSVAFSPDGNVALSGSDDNTLKLWDLTSGRVLKTLSGHRGDVYSVAFSPDGKMVLSGSKDRTLMLWGSLYTPSEDIRNAFALAKSDGFLKSWQAFFADYSEKTILSDAQGLLVQAVSSIYKLTAKENNIAGYVRFLKNHPEAAEAEDALGQMHELAYREAKGIGSISAYNDFILTYPTAKKEQAVSSIYKLTAKESNIAGYAWFLENYPNASEATQALTRMHELAFKMARRVDSIDAYNDFIIAYPLAKQVKDASNRAYDLDEDEYTGFFRDEEKEARRLLIRSKILEQSAEDLSPSERIGYMIVVNRMNDFLKREFNSTDAALRHLESNEFKSFVKSFKSAMKDLNRQVARIAANTEDLSSIMTSQSRMMNNHFNNAAQDRKMEAQMVKQHRQWERYIGVVGQ